MNGRIVHRETVTLEYQRDPKATPLCRIKARTRDGWLNAPDLNAFARWVESVEEDFLMWGEREKGRGEEERREQVWPR